MPETLEIRTMSRGELDVAVDWAAVEGWNPGWFDAMAFHAADPDGYLVGVQNGEPVACISVVRYGEDFGFLGFYIVRPEARGRGHGLAIWRAGLEKVSGRNVGLDGVPAQQQNYRRSGFRLAWRNIRFQGSLRNIGAPRNAIVIDAMTVPFDRLAAYDRRFFPAARERFLSLWISLPEHVARVAIRNGDIAGFAVARPCSEGTKIGPLYAQDSGLALALIRDIVATRISFPLIIDVPEPNAAALALVDKLGFEPVFETARMYTGPAPIIEMSGLFGVTSFELG